jgi:phosphosulfolactate phosphohydrolase-like enzyme
MVIVPLSFTTELLYYHFHVKIASVVQICMRKAQQACVAPNLVCSNVEVVGVFRSICCQGGAVLWTVGLKEDIKYCIQKDSVVIIQVVVGYGFCMDVESVSSVKVGSFTVVL